MSDLEHVREQEEEAGVHAGPQSNGGQDSQAHPPHQVLRHMLRCRQPGLLLACTPFLESKSNLPLNLEKVELPEAA